MSYLVNRSQAGRHLAEKLDHYRSEKPLLVLGLPRGGVPVAFEVAEYLKAPLDVCVVRKLGLPGQEELAMGAIASGGGRYLNQEVLSLTGISSRAIEAVEKKEREELQRREVIFRKDKSPLNVAGTTVILVDDGLATGSTMFAAMQGIRNQHPKKLVVAVPVAPPDTSELVRKEADDFVCLYTPEPFFGVGMWYEDFKQTTDEEVSQLLQEAKKFSKENERKKSA